jgi:anti-anti-sigma factor
MNYFSSANFNEYIELTITTPRFDSNVSPLLKTELIKIFQENPTHILLNLSYSKYCDSTGLSVLLQAQRLCTQNGNKLIIFGVNEIIKSIFNVSKLNSVFQIVTNKNEALELLK